MLDITSDVWLGEVPSYWRPTRIKRVCKIAPTFSNGKPKEFDECTVVPMEAVSEYGAVATAIREPFADVTPGLNLFEKGDVLFAKITPCMENGKGAFVETLPTPYAFGSTEFHVLRPFHEADGRFIYYFTFNPTFRAWAEKNMHGAAGQQRVSARFLKYTHLPLPPLPEQKRIAAYLDASCAAIDRAVETKQKQLDTFDVLRKSIIQKAVTQGINPDVEMKDSGELLFGLIPSAWKIDRLKDVAAKNYDAIKVGPFGSDLLLADMVEEGVKVYNQRSVIDRDFTGGTHFITEEKYERMTAFTVYPGDLLITTRGTIGRCVVVPSSARLGILHPCLMRVQADPRHILPEYLAILIERCPLVLRQLEMMSATTTIAVIYSEKLKRIYLPLPPVDEQRKIMQFLDRELGKVTDVESNLFSQIAALTAYRKSLIHECVTGKKRITDKDVTEVEAHV